MKPPTTTDRDSRPMLFGPTGSAVANTPQPPGMLAIWWERFRLHVDPVSKVASTLSSVLLVVWSIGLFVGGLIFLFYYMNIGFMPELDLDASLTLLSVSAITGSFLFLVVVAIFLLPSAIWINMLRISEPLKKLLSDRDGKLLYRRLSAWLSLPICVILVVFSTSTLLKTKGIGGWWIEWVSLLSVVLAGGGILVGCLRQKLKKHKRDFDTKERRKAIEIYLANLLQSSGFIVMCVIILIPLMIKTLTPIMSASYPNMTLIVFVFTVTLAACCIAFFDAFMVLVFFERPDRRLLRMMIFVMPLIIFLGLLGFFTHITDTVMSIYKFGNVHSASLILDESGCTIAKYHGVQPTTVLKEQTCRLDCVKILSRLGSSYYVDASGPNSLSTNFTIPSQNVLSWGLASKSVLDSCAAKVSSPPAQGSLTPSP